MIIYLGLSVPFLAWLLRLAQIDFPYSIFCIIIFVWLLRSNLAKREREILSSLANTYIFQRLLFEFFYLEYHVRKSAFGTILFILNFSLMYFYIFFFQEGNIVLKQLSYYLWIFGMLYSRIRLSLLVNVFDDLIKMDKSKSSGLGHSPSSLENCKEREERLRCSVWILLLELFNLGIQKNRAEYREVSHNKKNISCLPILLTQKLTFDLVRARPFFLYGRIMQLYYGFLFTLILSSCFSLANKIT